MSFQAVVAFGNIEANRANWRLQSHANANSKQSCQRFGGRKLAAPGTAAIGESHELQLALKAETQFDVAVNLIVAKLRGIVVATNGIRAANKLLLEGRKLTDGLSGHATNR